MRRTNHLFLFLFTFYTYLVFFFYPMCAHTAHNGPRNQDTCYSSSKIDCLSLMMCFTYSWVISDFACMHFSAFMEHLFPWVEYLGFVVFLTSPRYQCSAPSRMACSATEQWAVPETQYSPQGPSLSSLLAGIRFRTL